MKRFLLIITVLVLGIGSTWAQYLDRTGWTVLASSACQDGSTGQADAMLDGSTTTYWHSRYNNDNAYGTSNGGYPHAFQLDLGSEKIFYGVRIQNRTDNQGNGGVKAYKIYVSNEPFTTSTTGFQANDVTAGKTPVLTGTFSDTQTGALNQAGGTIEMSGRYLLFVITDGYKQNSWSGNHAHVAEVNLLATPHNSYIGSTKTNIGTTEWRTKENWSLQDIWNNNGPGCSSSGMWGAIYLQDINGGTIPALDGWNFRMTADHSTYTIESVGKIQFTSGNESYISLKNTSHVTMNFGNGQANPFIVNLYEGTGNILDFAMSDGFGSQITVNYGSVSKDMNRKFNAAGSGTINTLILNATIEGSIISSENTLHSVVLGNVSSVNNLTSNITTENFLLTTGVLTASDDNVGKYSIVKGDNGDITLYWVTGPEVDIDNILGGAFAGTTNINSGILTVNTNSSSISKNASGDIVLNNTTNFNTFGTETSGWFNQNKTQRPQTTISFRLTLEAPESFTKIFTYSTGSDWHVDTGGEIGIGITPELKLGGLSENTEYKKNSSPEPSTGELSAGTHIITVTLGDANNSYGTRIYVDNHTTYYSSSNLKTSDKNFTHILINSAIASKINALYVYKKVLTSEEIANAFFSIKNIPVPTQFPDNTKLYVIKGHNESNSPDVYYDGSNNYVSISTTSGDTDNYKWAIYTKNDKIFMYNFGAKKFVCQLSGIGIDSWLLKDNEANEMIITKHSNANAFDYFTFRSKYCKGEQEFMHYQTSGYDYGSTNWSDDVDDSKWRIAEVCELTQAQQDAIAQAFEEHAHLSQTEVDVAKANIITGVGYPKTSTDTYQTLNDLSTSTMAYDVDIDDIVQAYKAESDVELPEDGKAYYIINGQYSSTGVMEANQYVLYNNNNSMAVKAYSETLDESCIWIVRKIEDGYYALVSATGNGGYIHWTNNTDANRSLATTYSETNSPTKTKMHIAKIVNSSYVIPTNVQLFGYLSLRGYRNDPNNKGTDAPIIFKGSEAGFDNTNGDIVRYTYNNNTSQYSTAVQFVEATDYTANKVSLKSPKVNDGKTYASICLPYPVKVPDGVTAYYCTLSGSALHMNDIGEKIPANTGAILVGGSEASTKTLSPATNETVDANVGTNVLGGVVSNTLTSTLGNPVYVLNGGQNAGIGFYPYSQTATLGAYKAYYAPQQGSRDFYSFGFDDSATGIESLFNAETNSEQNGTFANGRKVFLQDGKVIILKDGKRYNLAGQMYK